MNLFVRKTYFDLPCPNPQVGPQKARLLQLLALNQLPADAAPSGLRGSLVFQELKAGTYAGRHVLLLLELCHDSKDLLALPAFGKLLLHQSSQRFQLRPDGQAQAYRLFNYVPFRAAGYQSFRRAGSLSAQQQLLARQLSQHLLVLASRLALPAPEQPLQDIQLVRQKKITLGNVPHLAFDLSFVSTVFLPEFLGVGLGTGVGLGVVRQVRGRRG